MGQGGNGKSTASMIVDSPSQSTGNHSDVQVGCGLRLAISLVRVHFADT